jgi:predicted alpha/beta-hydrolase family hydrolase
MTFAHGAGAGMDHSFMVDMANTLAESRRRHIEI